MKASPVYFLFELKGMTRFQRFKDRLIQPFLIGLHRTGITANHLSCLSAGTIFGTVLYAMNTGNEQGLLYGLAAHIILDGLDGPMARLEKKKEIGGSFVDSTCDLIGVVLVSVYIAHTYPSLVILSLLFAASYVAMVSHVFVLGLLRKQLRYGTRPRFYVYAALATDILLGMGTEVLEIVMLISTLILISISMFSFGKIHTILNLS